MSALTVKLPTDEPSASIALVAHYCGHGESLAILPDADVAEPQLRTKPFGKCVAAEQRRRDVTCWKTQYRSRSLSSKVPD